MRYHAKKKASDQPVTKKPKLTRAQESKKRSLLAKVYCNINTNTEKIHIENNNTVLPLLRNKHPDPVPISTSTIHVITPKKNINTENSFL